MLYCCAYTHLELFENVKPKVEKLLQYFTNGPLKTESSSLYYNIWCWNRDFMIEPIMQMLLHCVHYMDVLFKELKKIYK